MTKRWVRYVVPVMVEVDCEDDKVTRVVSLPGEIREDRDDRGHFLVYDDKFVRRHDDESPQLEAVSAARPRWEYPQFPVGQPCNWPDMSEWDEDFDPDGPDEEYDPSRAYRPVGEQDDD
ncbi:hypothetical protein [Streptomyces collinus]|uniref:hypothetical protein n=1 Tax=Streptomyces collinus TaxID=42684 RepID=UPI00362744C4